MTAFVEFYIACNPPLLPQGVSEVIRRVQDAEGLLEILYEPHVPWFKCITLCERRHDITAAVQDSLLAIADEDVDAIDLEEPTDGDVAILSDAPRMTPWSVYKHDAPHAFAEGDVYPEPVAEARYKTVWRGLEEHSGGGDATWEALLEQTTLSHEELEALTQCQILYNPRQTVLYIGSGASWDAITTAVERLEGMMRSYAENSTRRARPRQHHALPPVATVTEPVSNDPFDDIPATINAALEESMAWTDPFKNDESLI